MTIKIILTYILNLKLIIKIRIMKLILIFSRTVRMIRIKEPSLIHKISKSKLSWMIQPHMIKSYNYWHLIKEINLNFNNIELIGLSGQTVLHNPSKKYSIQLGSGKEIYNKINIPICTSSNSLFPSSP